MMSHIKLWSDSYTYMDISNDVDETVAIFNLHEDVCVLKEQLQSAKTQGIVDAIAACTTNPMIDGCRESVCKVSDLEKYIEGLSK